MVPMQMLKGTIETTLNAANLTFHQYFLDRNSMHFIFFSKSKIKKNEWKQKHGQCNSRYINYHCKLTINKKGRVGWVTNVIFLQPCDVTYLFIYIHKLHNVDREQNEILRCHCKNHKVNIYVYGVRQYNHITTLWPISNILRKVIIK